LRVAAIRYFMLKFSRGKLIVFDMEEALSFEGETGPYLQYAVVRANNIFNKCATRRRTEATSLRTRLGAEIDELQSVMRMPTTCGPSFSKRRAWTTSSTRLFVLSNSRFWANTRSGWHSFQRVYHDYPILNEEEIDRDGGGAAVSPTSARS
jgi:arginyl-tRNA synthetase